MEVTSADMKQVLAELDILATCKSPYIVEFYGAFYSRSSVYLCIENMDYGSLNKMIRESKDNSLRIPEHVLVAISYSVIKALYFLSEELSIMHRG